MGDCLGECGLWGDCLGCVNCGEESPTVGGTISLGVGPELDNAEGAEHKHACMHSFSLPLAVDVTAASNPCLHSP